MNKIVLISVAAIASACSGSAGMAQTGDGADRRSYALSGFERVSVVGPHRVVVTVGPAFSVSAEGPAATLARTEVEVENGELKIHPVEDAYEKRSWADYEAATFQVTLPRLEAAAMVGSGEMSVDRVDGEDFAGTIAGSGKLGVEALSVRQANFSVAGSGELAARGSARRSEVSIAGSGTVRAHGLSSDDASISIAGSGDAQLTVRKEANVSIVGNGAVDVAGPARCTVSRIGSGEVRCADIQRETEISFR